MSFVDGLSKVGERTFLNCFKAAITLKYSRQLVLIFCLATNALIYSKGLILIK